MRLRQSARLERVMACLVLLIRQLFNELVTLDFLHLFVLNQLLVQARRDLIAAPPDHVVFEISSGRNYSLLLARLILRVIAHCKLNTLRVSTVDEAVLGLKVRFLRAIILRSRNGISRFRNTDGLTILEGGFDPRASRLLFGRLRAP